MKKICSFLLALLFIAALAGCGASESSQSSSTHPSSAEKFSESQSAPNELGELLGKTYTDLLGCGRYFLHYQGTISAEGMTMNVETTYAIDGNTVATTMIGEQIKTHTLIKDGVYYALNDTAKTYTVIEVPPEMEDPFSGEAMTYVGKGMATVDGKEMQYEEYNDGMSVLRFYFDGKTLSAIAGAV